MKKQSVFFHMPNHNTNIPPNCCDLSPPTLILVPSSTNYQIMLPKKLRNCYASAMKNSIIVSSLIAASLSLGACSSLPSSEVELVRTDEGYRLLKDGQPHVIYGAGGTADLKLLAKYGGNTIRTWDAEGIGDLLDEAHANGISVIAGIWLEHQRHGFDYNEPAQRRQQLDRVEQLVKEHRDHPALLAWGVGNEVELGGDFDVALRQINDAAKIIKKLDPHHPRVAIIAEIGDDKAVRIQNECPDIDFLGINTYGGLGNLTDRLTQQGYTGAWAITEYGVLGHWEAGTTPWGAPYEQSSSQKADFLREAYASTIESNLGKSCLGSFAFLWGNKQEKTETWYGLLLPSGETTERVDVLSEFWTGKAPENLAPRVQGISLADANPHGLAPSQRVEARVVTNDPDSDPLSIEWRVLPESSAQSMGGDFEQSISAADVMIEPGTGNNAFITMPEAQGAYRIFVTVRDGKGHAGTANLPVWIGDQPE